MQRKISTARRVRLLFYAGILLFFLLLPREAVENGPVRCPAAFWGRQCPFCGITRAMTCLMKGDFSGAYAYHSVFTAVLFPLFLFFAGQDCFVIFRRRPLSLVEYLWRGDRR